MQWKFKEKLLKQRKLVPTKQDQILQDYKSKNIIKITIKRAKNRAKFSFLGLKRYWAKYKI